MHESFMKYALDLAQRGSGFTNPNPLVGALIVRDGSIIAEGYHHYCGGEHAEVDALKNSFADPAGATMYVTLEPCSHYGRTPPCVDAIIAAGIKHVFVGCCDPNPLVAGRGIAKLRDAGIEVSEGVLEDECRRLNEIFFSYITRRRPFVILKSAMTLDGKIATHSGDSRWVTGAESRAFVHTLRQRCAAVMTGIGTVLADDPSLTTRIEGAKTRDALRVIVDSRGRTPLSSRILTQKSDAKTLIALTQAAPAESITALEKAGAKVLVLPEQKGRVDLAALMGELYKMQIDSVLLEGGSTLNYAALEAGIVDKVLFFIAPKILGGENAKTPVGGEGVAYMKDAIEVYSLSCHNFSGDLLVEGYLRKEAPYCSQD